MRSIVIACLLAVFAAVPAHAFPHLTVTACDTVSTSPLEVRTTFTLDIPGPAGPWYEMDVTARPGSGTVIFDCGGAPATWTCSSFAYGSPPPTLAFYKPGSFFQTNDHLEGFAIVANQPAPCVSIQFISALLGDGSYSIDGCLMKDGPTPAHAISWGSVKSLYR